MIGVKQVETVGILYMGSDLFGSIDQHTIIRTERKRQIVYHRKKEKKKKEGKEGESMEGRKKGESEGEGMKIGREGGRNRGREKGGRKQSSLILTFPVREASCRKEPPYTADRFF